MHCENKSHSQAKSTQNRYREKGKLVDEMEEKFQLLRPTLIARSAYGSHIHKYRIYISIVCIVFVTVFLHFFFRVLTKASVRFLFFLPPSQKFIWFAKFAGSRMEQEFRYDNWTFRCKNKKKNKEKKNYFCLRTLRSSFLIYVKCCITVLITLSHVNGESVRKKAVFGLLKV